MCILCISHTIKNSFIFVCVYSFFRYFHAFKFAFTRQPQVKNVCRVVAVEQPIAKTGMAEATAAETSS